jgi:hypothetical protein
MLSAADALQVLPDIQQPIAPEMLLDLNDCGGATTLLTSPVPATPPLLGSINLLTIWGTDLSQFKAL